MQLSLFDDVEVRSEAIEYVVTSIITSDSIRGYIKNALKDNDRNKLIKLFNESIRTYGFGHGCYFWSRGIVEDRKNNESFKVTARELADLSLKMKDVFLNEKKNS